MQVQYFDPNDTRSLLECIDSIGDVSLIDNIIEESSSEAERMQSFYDAFTKESVIDLDRLTLRYLSCKLCLHKLADRLVMRHESMGVQIRGICQDMDHVYLGYLETGREKTLFMNCPHARELQKNCYYIKGKARIHLGSLIKENMHDYDNVRVMIQMSESAKEKIIDRYYLRS